MRFLRRNVFWVYAVYAASVLSGLVTTRILLDGLGTDGFGLWAVIGSLTAYLALLDLGVGPSVVRFGAEYRGRRSLEDTNALASVGLAIYAAIGAATLILGAALAWLLPLLVEIPDDLLWPARLAVLIVVAGLAARFPLGLFGNLLAAQQRSDVLNIAGVVSTLAYAVAVVVVFASGGGLVEVALIALGSTLIRLVLPLAWLRRELPALRPRLSLVTRRRARELLSVSGDNLLIHIGARVVFSTDVVVVGVLLGPEAAAFYAIPARLFALAFGMGTAGTNLLYPAFAELEGAEEPVRQRVYLRSGLRGGMAAMLFVALPLLLLPDHLITAWIGRELGPSTWVMILLALGLFLHQPVHVLSQYLIARGQQRPLVRILVVTVLLNVALSIALALTVGLWGVALATVLAELLAVALVPRLTSRVSGVPLASLARSALRPVLPAVALAVPTLLVLGRWLWVRDDLLALAPLGLLWIAAFVPALWLLGLDRGERAALGRKLRPGRLAAG
ncbi:MAG: oligosaccharide flippase family protein [Actinobacteria bacterium]|nr:oligosaccharide flippase family protein [Actinomycetota bacterium]